MRIRQGNDFIFLWAIERNELPEDFSNAENIRLHFKNFDCVGEVKTFQIVDGNIVRVEVSPEWASRLGAYRLILSYEFENNSYSDGDRKCVVDVLAFNIVPKTSEADDVTEMAKTTDIMIGFYGLSAYEVWLKDNPDKPKEDYYNWLRQPATDAVSLIDDKIEHLDEVIDSSTANEAERVGAETLRLQSENLRISAETERKANEVERLANEASRASDELIREANESSRKQYEVTRKTNESDRETAELIRQSSESERSENEGLRVNAETVREQQEQARQTNTATAITNAENAITDVNVAKDDYYDVVKPDIIAQGEYATEQGDYAKAQGEAIQSDLGLKLDKSSVKQVLGASTTDVMSQKAVTDKIGDLNKPIATYTYDLNPEKTITSIDVVTGTFTSASHGLANGNAVSFAKNKTTLDARNPLYFLPNGVSIAPYYVINATTDTFQISATIGGSALVMTSNATMNLTKVHLEILSTKSVTISGLPVSGNYKANLRLNCTGWTGASIQFRPTTYANASRWLTSTGSTLFGGITYIDIGSISNLTNLVVINAEFSLIGGHKNAIYKGLSSIYREASLVASSNTNLVLDDIVPNSTADITSIIVTSTSASFYVLNGTTIEVYKL